MTRCTFAICATLFACGTVFGQESLDDARKEAVDATWHDLDQPMGTDATDLDFDPTFRDGGRAAYWPPSTGGVEDYGLRVSSRLIITGINPLRFATVRYALAKHRYVSGGNVTWDAVVLRTDANGTADASFALNGMKVVHTQMTYMHDAAIGSGTTPRTYFVGQSVQTGFSDNDMTVHCVDPSAASGACSGWPAGSFVRIWFDIGGGKHDVATRVVHDPDGFLFIGGYAQTAIGWNAAIAKIDANTGALVTSFGTGGKANFNLSGRTASVDHNVLDMALSSSTTPGGKWLYFSGDHRSTTDDYDGYVMYLNPTTGTGRSMNIHHESDNTTYKDDAVTAISVLANGKLAFAGYSHTDYDLYPALLLGRLDTSGINLAYDPSFCGAGRCAKSQGGDPFFLGGTRYVRPTAIAERPGNRDLVIALNGMQQPTLIGGGAWRNYQRVEQYGADGNARHAYQRISFSASTDATPQALSAGMEVTNDHVLLAGSRFWYSSPSNGEDWDITLSRMLANDSIFASQFGGANSD